MIDEQKIYGLGFDEIVERAKADGAGGFDRYALLYSTTGEPAAQLAADGRPVERYTQSALGKRKVFVDVERPTASQVAATPNSIRIELSEQVQEPAAVGGSSGALRAQAQGIALADLETGAPIDVVAKLAPEPGPGLERRRLEIEVPNPPAAGTQVKLSLAPQALEDFFANRPDGMSEWTFAWPATGISIVEDTAPPELVRALLKDGKIEATFSKAVTAAGVGDAASVDGASVGWSVSASGLVATTSMVLTSGSHHVEFGTGPIDLAGKGLAAPIEVDLTVPSVSLRAQTGTGTLLFEPRDPRELDQSPTGQQASFQGHPVDAETGFVYLRNRYFDPELGRFITADPMGYPDGPSEYAFGAGDSVNGRDPMGLGDDVCWDCNLNQGAGSLTEAASTLWNLATQQFQAVKGSVEELNAYYRAYKAGGIRAVKVLQEHIQEARWNAFKDSIPFYGTWRKKQRTEAECLKADKFECGRHLFRTVTGATLDAAIVVGAGESLAGSSASFDSIFERALAETFAELKIVDIERWVPRMQRLPRSTTGFIANAEAKSFGKTVGTGTVDVRATIEGIESGAIKPRAVFKNRPLPGETTPKLPIRPENYYQEFVQPTPGSVGVGPERIVRGLGGELYYTPDHYRTFIPLN